VGNLVLTFFSVMDPGSLNSDPDPAFQVNPDTDPVLDPDPGV
jgi:hypothetical protein